MTHTRDDNPIAGDRALELTYCDVCGEATYAPHADIAMGLAITCTRSHTPRSITEMVRVSEAPKRKRQGYAKQAKRQSNQREIAAIDRIAYPGGKPQPGLLAGRLREDTLKKLAALKNELEGGE